MGSVPNHRLPALYALADVFVGPSVVERGGDTESFGVVFAEAMASGCPVIATDVGGIRDLVRPLETGLVVPPRDTVALAAAVCRILDDPELRARLRARSLRSVREDFDHRALHGAYANLIEDAAA
jgi:phosphatidylinositol alpha-mannosyltransferase